jgi:hypothetical protein
VERILHHGTYNLILLWRQALRAKGRRRRWGPRPLGLGREQTLGLLCRPTPIHAESFAKFRFTLEVAGLVKALFDHFLLFHGGAIIHLFDHFVDRRQYRGEQVPRVHSSVPGVRC